MCWLERADASEGQLCKIGRSRMRAGDGGIFIVSYKEE